MKKSIKLICLVLMANFFTITIKAQAMQDSISVIISPGTLSKQQVNDVKVAIKNAGGVNYMGYCSNHNIYLLYINSQVYTSAIAFYNSIKTTSGVNTLLLKEGSVDDIRDFCSFSDPIEASSIKTKYGH